MSRRGQGSRGCATSSSFGAGIWGEAVARGGLYVPGDAEATAAAISGSEGLFRAALLTALLMALCDAGVAVLPSVLGWLLAASGAVYLVGTAVHIAAPANIGAH